MTTTGRALALDLALEHIEWNINYINDFYER